ncbi:MAG: hypothetical protein O2923_01795 [Verrucomicrobia bacterium]|nr:hypothetical protein [Verrucomicrobiota bacterium]
MTESSALDETAMAKKVEQSIDVKWSEPITISIPARSGTEYKIRMGKGASLEYSWDTDKGKLFFDFHGEPTNGKAGYFESYKKDTFARGEGSFEAPFEGTHGWYWKNNNAHAVLITLKLKGSYILIDKR